MRGGFWRVAEGPAHLCEALSIEPALADALFDGPAVGARFAAADVMMAALVMEHEKADGIALPVEQAGIQNNDAACRQTQIGQTRVEHRPRIRTPQSIGMRARPTSIIRESMVEILMSPTSLVLITRKTSRTGTSEFD